MAPKKKPNKKPQGDSASANKTPAPKESTQAGKKSGGVAKKPPPKKAVGKTSAGIKKETKKKATKATGKAADTVIEDEVSGKPAGNTRAATKKRSKEEPVRLVGELITATATTKRSKQNPTKPAVKTSAATREPTTEPVGIPNEEDAPAVSPKRKRKTEDKWTETTDLPVPKAPKLDEGSSPSPSRQSREIRTLEEFALEGWDIHNFNSEICCIETVELCRIPSPFANLADRAERLKHIIRNHAHPRARALFDTIRGEDTASLRSALHEHPPGALVARQYDMAGPEFLAVGSNPEFSLELKRGNGPKPGIPFDFHIRKNSQTGELGYFAVNKVWNLFIINEKLIGRKTAAGPLPDFAVIQIEKWVIFWWRTRAALEYIPEAMSQPAKGIEEEGATKGSSPPPPDSNKGEDATKEPSPPPASTEKEGDTSKEPSPPPTSVIEGGDIAKEPTSPSSSGSGAGESTDGPGPPKTWGEILHDCLAIHREQRAGAGDSHKYHKIKFVSGMTIDDVLFAIATIWEPLRKSGTDFAFAGTDVIDEDLELLATAGQLEHVGVVGEGNTFIMPLFFPPDNEEAKEGEANANANAENSSSELGHLLLAIAEKASADSTEVKIDIFDSRKRTVDRDMIRKRAKELARAWVGPKVEATFVFREVPQQTHTSNACGIYVILNAWTIMLEIGLHGGPRRRPRCGKNSNFLDHGLEIVNLALAGFMDARTIRAFLNFYGYTHREEDINKDDTERAVRAVRMDPTRFRGALQRAWALQLSLPSSASSAQSSGSDGQDTVKPFPDHLLQEFLDNVPAGTTRAQAESFLEIAAGDVDNAVVEFMKHMSSQPDGSA